MSKKFGEILSNIIFYLNMKSDILSSDKYGYIPYDPLFCQPIKLYSLTWKVLHVGNRFYIERKALQEDHIIRFQFDLIKDKEEKYFFHILELDEFINGEYFKNNCP